jgi:polar amino acid transport system ATP-binding protein
VTIAQRIVEKRTREEANATAMKLLEEVGLADRAASYPYQLSGGQKQRVAIARALAQPLKVLLLDEPTSALDPEMREEVRGVLREVAHRTKLTMVLVTHEMSLAMELGHQLWVMDKGGIVERGVPKEIVAHPKSDIARDFFAKLR